MTRSALITGAASGIGAATVEMLVMGGWQCHALDVNADGLNKLVSRLDLNGAGDIKTHVIDLSDWEAVESIALKICSENTIDVLINNAGTAVANTLPDTDRETWHRIFDVNVHAMYELCRVVIPHMIQAGQGVIVNVASVAAIVGIANRAAYCATKGAVVSLTRALATDHSDDNIRVNAICPGTTDTGWIADILSDHPRPDSAMESMKNRQLLNRLGRPEEIAHAIKFLIDSSFTTGSCLIIDGGMTTT